MTDKTAPIPDDTTITDIVDGILSGPEWDAWLAANPEAAAEVQIARRVRALMEELRAASIEAPEGFEARLIARVRQDATLLDLFDLGFVGISRVVFELLEALFAFFPPPQPQPAA